MDELKRNSRFARRVALASLIACSVTSAFANEGGSSSFKALLSNGWADASAQQSSKTVAVEKTETNPSTANSDQAARSEQKVAETKPQPKPEASTAAKALAPTLIRPKLRVLEVPAEVGKQVSTSSVADTTKADSKAQSDVKDVEPQKPEPEKPASSLAQLIKQRTKPIVVPKVEKDENVVGVELKPEVSRLDIEEQIAANQKRLLPAEESASVVEAKPILPPIPAPKAVEEEVVETTKIAEKSVVAEQSQIAAKPEVEEDGKEVESVPADQTPSKIAVVEEAPQENLPPAPQLTPDTEASTAISALQTLQEIRPDAPVRLQPEPVKARPRLSAAASIHVARLGSQARESLQVARDRLKRRATHSAQKHALDALRFIVAMQDAQVGGNHHNKALDIALDAIREAEDFCGRFGPVDSRAIQRMVTVHETTVLKEADLGSMSAIEATEAYLQVAHDNLVMSAARSRDASIALVLLGQIETQVAKNSNTHSAAVAVMLQQSAIEIDGQNWMAFQSLGHTFLQQGLALQASDALQESIRLYPTRSSYRSLQLAARQQGDVETARLCSLALNSETLPNEFPIRQLSPRDFAATHRLSPANTPARPKSPPAAKPPVEKKSPQRVSLRTLFPFSRR